MRDAPRRAIPYLMFARATRLLNPDAPPPRRAFIRSPSSAGDAMLGDGVSIGPFVVIEAGARIGARTIVRAHAVIGAGADARRRLPRPRARLDPRARARSARAA